MPQKPTSVRFWVLAATTLSAFLMYLDRACLTWMLDSDSFRQEIHLDKDQSSLLKSAFFWAYALAQVPAGWLAERYGKRKLMTALIVLWSAFTALTGFSTGFWMLLIARLGCGLAEAGAYPISGSLLSRWANVNWRAFASGIVSIGGRLGFVLAPIITLQVIGLTGNWRWAGWVYGLVGIFAAWYFWKTFRETPEEHPEANDEERALLNEGRSLEPATAATVPAAESIRRPAGPAGSAENPYRTPETLPAAAGGKPKSYFPWKAVVTDGSLWLMCAYQLLTNFGWAFVINSMSTYLREVWQLSDQQNGRVSTFALAIGLPGIFIGGYITDKLTAKYGLRKGRFLPLCITRFVSAAACLGCIWVQNPWMVAVCLGIMVFSTDFGLPAVWAWAQDVGGKSVAPIFGWANMWGNFGAALQPMIAVWILSQFDTNHDQKEVFMACAIAFALAGVLSFGINASKPVGSTASS